MPRARTGTVHAEWHGDHYDFRFDLPRGGSSKRKCLPSPERQRGESAEQTKARAKDEAKAEARRIKAIVWAHGGELKEKPPAVAAVAGETFDTWAYRWLAERKERGLACYEDDEGRYRKWIFPHLGDKPATSIEKIDLERFVEDLDGRVRAGDLSWRTARHVWGLITKMFSDACRSKRLALRIREDNPARDVRGPDRGVSKAKSYLYPEELLAVVSCEVVPLRWRRLFALMVYTYTRPGELAALEWSDVDFARGTIHVHRALDDDDESKPTKTKVTRRIPIEPGLLPLLETMSAEKTSARVVESMPPECDLSKRLRDYLKRAGVTRAELFANDATRKQVRFYDLRATGITWMAIRGDEPLRIMQRAGHVEFNTTMGYVREAETLGRTGEPFPPLPPLTTDEPETPSTWARKGWEARRKAVEVAPISPARILAANPGRGELSMRNVASPAGFEADATVQNRSLNVVISANAGHDSEGFAEPSKDTTTHAHATVTPEGALERALVLAAEAGRFDVVAKLADELHARRVADAGNVVVMGKKR